MASVGLARRHDTEDTEGGSMSDDIVTIALLFQLALGFGMGYQVRGIHDRRKKGETP